MEKESVKNTEKRPHNKTQKFSATMDELHKLWLEEKKKSFRKTRKKIIKSACFGSKWIIYPSNCKNLYSTAHMCTACTMYMQNANRCGYSKAWICS